MGRNHAIFHDWISDSDACCFWLSKQCTISTYFFSNQQITLPLWALYSSVKKGTIFWWWEKRCFADWQLYNNPHYVAVWLWYAAPAVKLSRLHSSNGVIHMHRVVANVVMAHAGAVIVVLNRPRMRTILRNNWGKTRNAERLPLDDFLILNPLLLKTWTQKAPQTSRPRWNECTAVLALIFSTYSRTETDVWRCVRSMGWPWEEITINSQTRLEKFSSPLIW